MGSKWLTLSLVVILFQVAFAVKQPESDLSYSPSERSARSFSWPSIWSFGQNHGISRQIFDMLDIVTDVAMLTLLGIPILGLVALGATALGPMVGSGAAAGRKKRDTTGIVDRAGRALLYARNLFDVLANLEEAFQRYDIKSSECQLKAICEVHRVGRNSDYKELGNQIIDLMRMQKDLEEYEIIPLAKIIFGVYADAANSGVSQKDCSSLYTNCQSDLMHFISNKRPAEGD